MTFVSPIINAITVAMGGVGAVLGVIAFVDAIIRRADAYAAADKQTKTIWLAITGASGVVLVLGIVPYLAVFPPPSLLWLAGMVGSLVYLLDVRPKLREVTGGKTSGW